MTQGSSDERRALCCRSEEGSGTIGVMLIGNFPNGRKFPFSPPLPIQARGICLEGLPVMIYHPELSYESYQREQGNYNGPNQSNHGCLVQTELLNHVSQAVAKKQPTKNPLLFVIYLPFILKKKNQDRLPNIFLDYTSLNYKKKTAHPK